MLLPKHRIPAEMIEGAYRTLLKSFREIYPLSEEVIEYIHNKAIPVLYKPRETILRYGELCNYSLFMIHGLVRSNMFQEQDEKIVWFMSSGDVAIGVESWFFQKPSDEQLTAIRETLCLAVSFSDIEFLRRNFGFQTLERMIIVSHFVLSLKRTLWQQMSSEGKVLNLAEKYPRLLKEVPAKDLASWLGISRDTFAVNLSKIKKQYRDLFKL